jgi:hypothetical protein
MVDPRAGLIAVKNRIPGIEPRMVEIKGAEVDRTYGKQMMVENFSWKTSCKEPLQ